MLFKYNKKNIKFKSYIWQTIINTLPLQTSPMTVDPPFVPPTSLTEVDPISMPHSLFTYPIIGSPTATVSLSNPTSYPITPIPPPFKDNLYPNPSPLPTIKVSRHKK